MSDLIGGVKKMNKVVVIFCLVWLLMLYGVLAMNPFPIIIAIIIMLLMPVLLIFS